MIQTHGSFEYCDHLPHTLCQHSLDGDTNLLTSHILLARQSRFLPISAQNLTVLSKKHCWCILEVSWRWLWWFSRNLANKHTQLCKQTNIMIPPKSYTLPGSKQAHCMVH